MLFQTGGTGTTGTVIQPPPVGGVGGGQSTIPANPPPTYTPTAQQQVTTTEFQVCAESVYGITCMPVFLTAKNLDE